MFPLELLEFIGSVVLGVMVALSNAGGIGGGGIIVPIAIIFFAFRTKQAVALSNFCIFIASLVRFAINYKQKHPHKEGKVIDYGIIMVMFPMILLGSLLGVQLNLILPDIVLLGSLTIILVLLSVKSFFTSLKIAKREKQLFSVANSIHSINSDHIKNNMIKNIDEEEVAGEIIETGEEMKEIHVNESHKEINAQILQNVLRPVEKDSKSIDEGDLKCESINEETERPHITKIIEEVGTILF